MSNDIILNIHKKYNYCVNISHPVIEPLFQYYRKRIGSIRWPLSDEQRFYFERIIINLCTEGLIKVEHWVLYEYFNVYKMPRYMEHGADEIPGANGPIMYKDIKAELKLICQGEAPKSSEDLLVLDRIKARCPITADLISKRKGA